MLNWYAYPPSIKNWMKATPSFGIFFTFAFLHVLIIYNVVYHSGERIEKFPWKSNKFERAVRREDDVCRIYTGPAGRWQPNAPEPIFQIRPLFRF